MALAFGSELTEREKKTRLGRVTLLLFLLAVALLGLVILRAYQARTTDATVHQVPVLQADAGPTRERPAEPGGMTVPNENSPVFRGLEGGVKDPPVERLLPPPEAPLPKPVAVTTTAKPLPLPPPPAPAAKPAQAAQSEPAPPTEIRVAEPPPDASAALILPDEPLRPKAPSDEMAMAIQMPTLAVPDTGFRVQLGSFRQAAEASKGWDKAVATAPKLLGPVSHFVIQTDLGADKGVFHRLQAGPFPSRESADSLCNQLKAKNLDCYVVSP